MKVMANLIRSGRYADEIMALYKDEPEDQFVGVGRNDPCPCGSGRKFKQCHGRKQVG